MDREKQLSSAWHEKWVRKPAPAGAKEVNGFKRNVMFQSMLNAWWKGWEPSKKWKNAKFADMLAMYYKHGEPQAFEQWVIGRD